MSNAKFSRAVAILNAHPARMTPDIDACFKPASNHFFSEQCFINGESLGIDWDIVLTLPQKQVKRATQFVNAISAGISSGFDKTHARLLLSMREAGHYQLTTNALHALAANMRKGDVNTRGVGLGTLNAKFKGHHGLSTVTAKTSNSIGKNGFMTVCGMVASDGKQNNAVFLNGDHPSIRKFFSVIDGMTESQIETIIS